MNYLQFVSPESTTSNKLVQANDTPAGERVKARRLIERKNSGGSVNLFYSDAPNSTEAWWTRIFNDGELPDRQESDIAYINSPSATRTEQERPAESSLSFITRFSSLWGNRDNEETEAAQAQVTGSKADAYRQVMSYLTGKGFSKEAAAGVAGVFMAESGLVAGRLNERENELYGMRAGRGLGQWTGPRRTQYEQFLNGRTPTIALDLDFFIQDLQSRPLVKAILDTSKDIAEIVDAMHRGYENGDSNNMTSPERMQARYSQAWKNQGITRPYVFTEEQQKRINYAIQAFQIS